jgi:hypothetical protein
MTVATLAGASLFLADEADHDVPLRLIQCAARSSKPHKARMMTPGRRTSERTTIFADSSAGKRQNT